jgi:hypothetical protein
MPPARSHDYADRPTFYAACSKPAQVRWILKRSMCSRTRLRVSGSLRRDSLGQRAGESSHITARKDFANAGGQVHSAPTRSETTGGDQARTP